MGLETTGTDDALDQLRSKKKILNGIPFMSGALYNVAPIVTKAATESGVESSIFAEGSYQYENQSGTFDGTDIGARTKTSSGLVGYKAKFTLPSDRQLTLGVFGGEDYTTMRMPLGDQSTTRAPTLGAYAEYDVGDSLWSELYYTHSWLHNSGLDCVASGVVVECAQETATATDEVEGNVHYRFNPDAENGKWWWEPTAGFAFDHATESQGLSNETSTRLQAGVNFGTSYKWGNVKVLPKLSAGLFDDVSVTGGTCAGCPPVGSDQGLLWGKGTGTLKFVWTNNFSSAIEGQVFGTSGNGKEIIDYVFLVNLKYRWGNTSEEEGD